METQMHKQNTRFADLLSSDLFVIDFTSINIDLVVVQYTFIYFEEEIVIICQNLHNTRLIFSDLDCLEK